MIKCKKECKMNEKGVCYCSCLLILRLDCSGLVCWPSSAAVKGTIPLEFWTCGNEECKHWFQLKSYKEEGYTIGHCDLDEMTYVDKCPEYSV